MGIFSRITTLLKANINDLISKSEDPEKILNQLILDMKEQLIEAKKQVAVAIADEKRLKKQLDNELMQSREWQKRAEQLVRAGRDDLAREALTRGASHDKLAEEYKKSWEQQKAAADQLRGALRQLNKKIDEASRRKNLLVARQKRAEAQKTIQNTMSSLTDTSAFDRMDQMAEKIDRMEAEIEAQQEISDLSTGDDLMAKFNNFEEEHAADEALAALKAKMGLTDSVTQKEVEEETVSVSSRSWDTDKL